MRDNKKQTFLKCAVMGPNSCMPGINKFVLSEIILSFFESIKQRQIIYKNETDYLGVELEYIYISYVRMFCLHRCLFTMYMLGA